MPTHLHSRAQTAPSGPPVGDTLPMDRRTWGLKTLGWLASGSLLGAGHPNATAADDSRFWQLLAEGGCVALMRHAATAPGIGDPPGFDLKQCSTQRNLSDMGRAQARQWGAWFVERHVKVAEVRTSAWCRCKDTAQLAFGRYRVWSPLNSFFENDRQSAGQTEDVVRFVQAMRTPHNVVLVTHQVNITALTDQPNAMGEMLLIRPSSRTAATDSPSAKTRSGPAFEVLARLQGPSQTQRPQ